MNDDYPKKNEFPVTAGRLWGSIKSDVWLPELDEDRVNQRRIQREAELYQKRVETMAALVGAQQGQTNAMPAGALANATHTDYPSQSIEVQDVENGRIITVMGGGKRRKYVSLATEPIQDAIARCITESRMA